MLYGGSISFMASSYEVMPLFSVCFPACSGNIHLKTILFLKETKLRYQKGKMLCQGNFHTEITPVVIAQVEKIWIVFAVVAKHHTVTLSY